MNKSSDTIRVVIPLSVRRRNGRPKILPPENAYAQEARAQDPHILKALGRAWAWRRRLESGATATVSEIAKEENVTDRFVSRTMRLAYLSPAVLEWLIVRREPLATSWNSLVDATYASWIGQFDLIFTRSESLAVNSCPELHPSSRSTRLYIA